MTQSIRPRERLAQTACCELWLVECSGSMTPCALKMLKPDLRRRPGAAELIRREHRWLTMLDHPHLIRCFGLVEHERSPALLLEYLPGGDLLSLTGFDARHWIGAAACVIDALRALHGAGIAHGDVKAQNVRFDVSGCVRLIDLGAAVPFGAKPSGPGTAAIRLPGRLRAEPVGPEGDVWQLAVLLYQLLSGRLPFGVAPDDDALRRSPPPALSPRQRRDPALAAVERAVFAVLDPVRDGASGDGSLSALADVIESVMAAQLRRSRVT